MPRCSPLLGCLLLGAFIGAGCGKKQPVASSAAGSAAAGHAPKILHYGNGSEPQDLDPQTVTGVPEHHLHLAFFEGLVSEDPQLIRLFTQEFEKLWLRHATD